MTRDLAAVVAEVAVFLGCPLGPDEAARVVDRCSFPYMKAREEAFEMAPPSMFSVGGSQFMTSGKVSRHEDVPAAVGDRIAAYCRDALRATDYGRHTPYEELKSPGTAEGRLQRGYDRGVHASIL
jgi:hypothetical protein